MGKMNEENLRQLEAKREKQANEMKMLQDQIKENEERKQAEKEISEQANKEIRDKFAEDRQV